MINIRSFYRKKTTKIYFMILTTLFILFSLLSSFKNYYITCLNGMQQASTTLFIVSKGDYYKELMQNKDLTHIRKALLFNYDEDDNSSNSLYENLYTIEKYIFVFPENKKNELKEKEISIGLSNQLIDEFTKLIGTTITLNLNGTSYEFVIRDFYNSNYFEVLLNNESFESLYKTNNSNFAYSVKFKDYRRIKKIEEKISLNDNIVLSTISEKYDDIRTSKQVTSLKELISILLICNYCYMLIFLVIFIVIIKNLLYDEFNISFLKKIIGYNNIQIRMRLFSNIICLNLSSILIGIFLSVIFLFTINTFFNINLTIFDLSLIVKLILTSSIISFVMCHTYKLKR